MPMLTVVIADKTVMQRLAENCKRDRRQKKANPKHRPAVIQTN